jgi:hypothetical protein
MRPSKGDQMGHDLKPETSKILAELATAQNQREGLEIFLRLVRLASNRAYWDDFELLVTSPRFDDPGYSRRLRPRLKIYLIWSLSQWAAPLLGLRLYRALTECVEREASNERCRELREHLVASWCANGWATTIDFARGVLSKGDESLRSAVMEGLTRAQFNRRPVEPGFAAGAAKILENELPRASSAERESWLGAIRVFSPSRWAELKADEPAPPPIDWTADYYRVHETAACWGDYGAILYHGMAMFGDEAMPLVHLERTGPFVPPVTLPTSVAVVVTDLIRTELEAAGLAGLTFRPVVLDKITRVDWHHWDQSDPRPGRYPSEAEPENYIMGRKDSAELHAQVGPLWQLVQRTPVALAHSSHMVVSTDVAKRLHDKAGNWVRFEPCSV